MKRAFIIHGWDGHPGEAWFPWLADELTKRGFDVQVPQMPTPEAPDMNTWVPYLAELVGAPDNETYLIGHSMGVQTIMRYLQSINEVIGGVVAVAGFFALKPLSLEGPEAEAIAEPWLTIPIDTDLVKAHTNSITAIFSDNDKYVGLDNVNLFADRLGAKTIVLHAKGHMGSEDNVPQIQEILDAVVDNE